MEGDESGQLTPPPPPAPPALPDEAAPLTPEQRAEGLARLAFALGSGFLDPKNIVGRSTAGQHLLMAARAAGRPTLTVDLRMRLVEPPSAKTPPVALALMQLEAQFRDGLRALGVDRNDILAAAISVKFDFATVRPSRLDGQMFSPQMIEPETVNYDCTVRIRNAEGEQRVRVPEWWR